MTAFSRRAAFARGLVCATSLLVLLTGCPSFGPVRIACDADEHCPETLRCGPERVCVPAGASGDGGGDGGGDAGGGDAGTGGDGDGGIDGGQMMQGHCASLSPAPFFCDDFDDGLDARWEVSTPRFATLAVDESASVSPPASLLVRTDVGADTPDVDLLVEEASGTSLRRRIVRADVRVEAVDPQGHRAVILRNMVGSEAVYIALHDSGSELYEHRAQSVPQIQLPQLPLNEWTRVELDLTVDPPNSKVTVRYGGIEGLKDHPVGLTSAPTAAARGTTGLFVNGTTTVETRVRFDNFVFDLAP